ncbi:hypothetical protein MRX96_013461 [Rhipicephalus microplus]
MPVANAEDKIWELRPLFTHGGSSTDVRAQEGLCFDFQEWAVSRHRDVVRPSMHASRILPQLYLNHFVRLVEAVHILLSEELTAPQLQCVGGHWKWCHGGTTSA